MLSPQKSLPVDLKKVKPVRFDQITVVLRTCGGCWDGLLQTALGLGLTPCCFLDLRTIYFPIFVLPADCLPTSKSSKKYFFLEQ
jgi:hypothetical protein